MSKGKAFNSAKLQPDGTVEVTGPFSLDPGEPKAPALLSFYLVQDSKTVEGDGRWLVGTPEWTGTGGSGLKAGPAQATALAVLVRSEPPGFMTLSWSQQVEVTAADPND
jgi:hypothetical protein